MVEVVVIEVLVSPLVSLEKKQKGEFIFAFVFFFNGGGERDNTSLFPLIHNL